MEKRHGTDGQIHRPRASGSDGVRPGPGQRLSGGAGEAKHREELEGRASASKEPVSPSKSSRSARSTEPVGEAKSAHSVASGVSGGAARVFTDRFRFPQLMQRQNKAPDLQERAGPPSRKFSAAKRTTDFFHVLDSGVHPDKGEVSRSQRWCIELINHRAFIVTMSLLILLNAVYIGVETDLKIPADGPEGGIWYGIDCLFTAIFLSELVLRINAERGLFHRDYWNIFDTVVVSTAVLDTLVLQQLNEEGSAATGLAKVGRVFLLMRVARIFRLMRFLKTMWLLVIGVLHAMRALFWAWVLLAIVIYAFAIFTTRVLGKAHPHDAEIREFFGNTRRSMFTFFQVMTLEGWPQIARSAMEKAPYIELVFVVFLIITTFSIMNVIVAVIVESTLAQAGDVKADQAKQLEEDQREAVQKVEKVFRQTDTDGNGQITREEFLVALQRSDVNSYLKEIGVDTRSAENLFEILDYDDSGTLDAVEFTQGVMKARGAAKAKDVLAVQCDIWRNEGRLRNQVAHFCKNVDARMARVDVEVDQLLKDLGRIAQGNWMLRPEALRSLDAA